VGNLVSNAVRATTEGFISVTAEDVTQINNVPAGYDGMIATSIVAITIEDTGSGMTPEFVKRLMTNPFTKGDSFEVRATDRGMVDGC
jgi:signal transduction histidine kinase